MDGRGLLRRAVAPINLLTLAVVLACLAGTYYFWFRDSSFVAVERVSVQGVSGPGSEEVTRALTEAAGGMTTLHVSDDVLEAAVAGFPTVVGVQADADFPNGLTIAVQDRPPGMVAKAGGRALPVAGDGTVLAGLDVKKASLPVVAVGELPEQGALEGADLQLAQVAGGAPDALRGLITGIEAGATGIEVTLEGDIPLYFGSAERAGDKWAAAAAALASPRIESVTHVDVRVPERPAVGGAAPPPADAGTGTQGVIP